MIPDFIKKLLIPSILLLGLTGFSQEFNNFEVRYQTNIKGDLTFISNQIVNRDGGTATTEPEDGYDNLNTDNDNDPETGGRRNFNDDKQMHYVNIDPGGGRFSSSTANLAFTNPDCNLIRYAGLYWSATYPSATANGSFGGTSGSYVANTVPVGDGRQNDFNQVQFRVPGGTYVNITADEVLFDGFTSTDPSVRENSPYACYADVTSLIAPLADPTGDYTVANVRATTGGLTPGGGSTGGWTLVVVYENPNLTGKLVTTFDGFARVRNTDQIDIQYDGFTTIPVGPVNADIGAATLEGDFRISGDFMSIEAASNTGFTAMSNAINPSNNFFNSNITLNGAPLPGRIPSSANTLGYDMDIFRLNNFNNSVIPNGETAATFRFGTNGDQYYPFFNSFNVEIIEPDIVLEKTVEDIAGNDITGLGVNLGQTLDYVLSFQNLGNDDGTNYTIRDVLPINVTLDENSYVLPTGMSPPTYDPASRTVVFTVPDDLIQVGDTAFSIRMRVRVAENCFDFIDACTDLIQNLAYSTYEGVINDNQITDDPSVTDFNNCGFIVPGATNFLLDDLESCNFTRTVQLCGDTVLLDAGNNFDSYVWVSDDNGNGLFDATDTVLQSGTSDTLLVSEEGTYIVDKIVADPCKGFKEIMVVERFGTNTADPILDYFNTVNADADVTNDIEGEIATCSIDGDLLTQIFLCGSGDAQLLQTSITDAQAISWELLDESSCTAAPDDCANKNASCTWNQIATGSSHTVNSAGKYRLVVTYQNGCFNRFYFDVFQNNLTIEYDTRDIICTTDGYINITNIGAGYGFQLIDITNNAILVPFSANNGPNFPIGTNGQYRVDVVQLDGSGNPIPNACVFSTPDIGIRDRDFQVDITTTPVNCNAQGTIQIGVLNVEPDYTYILRQSDGTLIDDETAQPDNTFTFNVNEGNYIIEVATDDGCTMTQNVTVARIPDPTVSAVLTQNIGCTAGTITVNATGGFPNPDYGFAIWSKDGTDLYATVGDIPGNAYQVENDFTFGWRDTNNDSIDEYFPGEDGTYVFVVVDANGCSALSNPVTISDNGAMTVSVTEDREISCSGSSDASITLVPSGGVGPFTYSIDDGTTTQTTPGFVGLSAGNYNLRITDSSGCDVQQVHTISEPFTLSASAGITELVECRSTNEAEVRITNAQGGTIPYAYSFDGGSSYSTDNFAFLSPGTYSLVLRDARDCEFPMTVTVPDEIVGPDLTPVVAYNCNGEGTVTISSSNTTDFDYTYELNSTLNSPPDSEIFENVPVGSHTVTVNYISNVSPATTTLLFEDFGAGPDTPISEAGPTYCYESQAVGVVDCDNGTGIRITDGEYLVSQGIVSLYPVWRSPNDHTGNPNGRFMAMGVGGGAGLGGIIYAKRNIEVVPNRDITLSLEAFNLVTSGSGASFGDPNIVIELVNNSGTIIASTSTGSVPKNINGDDWYSYSVELNTGSETTVDIVLRTFSTIGQGNDIAIDDIRAVQNPLVCSSSIDIPIIIEAGRSFVAGSGNTTNVSCNGLSDGTITFEVDNFDATAGFDYSLDGGTTYTNSTTSPVTTPAIYGAGSHTVLIRKADEITCTTSVTTTITEPDPLIADASITTALTCTNGATITASATGGTPNYIYQLEDGAGGVVSGYDFTTNGNNAVFTGLSSGDYIVYVRDKNGNTGYCEDAIDMAIPIAPLNPIVFDITPTNCYSGASDGAIVVNVTNGNGDYQFRIDSGSGPGPWITPAPANATTHTFDNLNDGSYAIEVRDGLGCPLTLPAPQTAIIAPQLNVSATAPNITACGMSTDIAITASGGNGTLVYAVALATDPVPSTFTATNPLAVTASGNYVVYVRDNANNSGVGGTIGTDFCQATFPITIVQDAPIAITPTPTDVSCFGGSDGAISIVVDSGGQGPFTYRINSGDAYVPGSDFSNLTAGTYPVQVRDANGCETTPVDVDVDQPDQLASEAVQSQDYECGQLGQITVGTTPTTTIPTSGGSGNYQYSINSGPWTASTTLGHTFIDLIDGTYSIQVRDANAVTCVITLADVIIPPLPVEPTFSSAITYNCDGTGEVTITPFDTGYTYILDGTLPGQTGAGANLFSNVSIGNHTLTVAYGSGCTVDVPLTVLDGNAFEASVIAFENLACNADNSGTITISADNFGASGYEYSLNGSAFVGPFTSDEQIMGLNAQVHSIIVRDVNTSVAAGCPITLGQELTEPDPLIASASETTPFTCSNSGATITASVIGGTPTYEYQLETSAGTIVRPYQTTVSFAGVPANAPTETYIVRVRDRAGIAPFCEDVIDLPITITMSTPPTAAAVAEVCYSGLNDGFITVTAAAGNPGYQFRIDSGSGPGPWITPVPANATTYTFNGLSDGTYDIDVRDAHGCVAPTQTETIYPALIASEEVTHVSACADGSIVINASGGNGTLVYAVVPAGTSPAGSFFTTPDFPINNATATANPSGFDIYVRDKNGAMPICEYLSEGIVITPSVALSAIATPTDPDCHDGLGSISTSVTGGAAPYTYSLVDMMSPADGIDYSVSFNGIPGTAFDFNGIGVGDYQITVTDANACSYTIPGTITINNVDDITIDIFSDLPPDCTTARSTTINVLTAPTNTLIRYSADGGTTWQASNIFAGPSYNSGTIISPSIEVTRPNGAICIQDFPDYLVPYPLDDLDITLTATIVGCELQVTVEGDEGSPGYRYTYTDDPDNFSSSTPVWTAVFPDNTPYTFANVDPTTPPAPGLPLLVPGREYVFYVEDSASCIRQSNVNVNDIVTLPIEITTDITPTCNGDTTGEIVFTLNPVAPSTDMRWEIFALGNATPIAVSGGGASAIDVTYTSSIGITGLGAGNYYIVVTQVDSGTDQCTSASENAYVDELDAIAGTPDVIRDISCNLPGLIQINGLTGGGGTPYTFDVTGPGTFAPLTGLNTNPVQIPVNSPAGAYTVTINDQYGCSLELPPVTLDLSPNPTISVSQDNCSMPISVNVSATSAVGNLRYAMVTAGDPAPTTYENNGGIFPNVTPGSYDFYVIDGNGCTDMEAMFVVNPVLDASATLTKLLDCSGAPDDAQITIAIANGSGSYDYAITNTAGAPAVSKQGVPGNTFVYNAPLNGDYTITVYDNNTPDNVSCNRQFTIQVAEELRPILSIEPLLVSNETCEYADNGSFTVAASNNTAGPFTFQITASSDLSVTLPINPTTFDGFNATFTSLTGSAVGTTYTVTATSDINDCEATIDQVITEPDPVDLPVANVEVIEFACTSGNNQNNASITVNLVEPGPPVSNVTGGSGNYVRYRFVNSTSSAVLQDGSNPTYIETNTAGGNYDVYVYDDNGCFNQTPTTVTILPFDELESVDATHTVSCNPITDGEVTIAVTSTANDATLFEYSIDNGATWQTELSHTGNQNVFSGLTIGIHNFLVRHANTGCILPVSETIVDPNTFEITILGTTNVSCMGEANGAVTFDVTDPMGGYTGDYSWNIFNTRGTPANTADDGPAVDSGTQASFGSTILSVGEYRISVFQDNAPGCTNEVFFSIAEPTDPLAGDRRITEITCVPTNNGIVEIFDATGGWGDYRYLVFNTTTAPAPDTNDRTIYNVSPRFEDLSAGTYQVWLIDANGCPLRLADAILEDPDPITAELQLNTQNCTDFEGELQVINQSGGQDILANYRYQLQLFNTTTSLFENFRPIQNSDIFSGLGAGRYQVIVSDQWGCTGTSINAIDILEPIVASTDIVKAIDCVAGNTGGAITIAQTGGSGSFDYSVTFPISGTVVSQPTGVFTNLTEPGAYVFTVTDRAIGNCSVMITETLQPAVDPIIRVDSFTDDTCNDATANGSISVSVTNNGISPYTFRIIDGDGSSPAAPIVPSSQTATTATFTGLTGAVGAGITYTIEVEGNNECTDTITQVITQPQPITNFNVPDGSFTCTAGNNTNFAVLTVDAGLTGGSNVFVNYTFINTGTGITVQDGANDSYTETDLAGGNYSITVRDDQGCEATTTAFIAPFVGISDPTVTVDQAVTCNPAIQEEIQVAVTVTPSSATPTLEFRAIGTNVTYDQTNPTGTFTGMGIGAYAISITNLDTGCVVQTTHEVIDPDVIEAVIAKSSDNPCLDDSGAFDLTTITNYTGGFSYQVYDGNDVAVPGAAYTGNSDTSSLPLAFTGLGGGSYYIEITETDAGSSMCSDNSNAITITEPTAAITFTPSEEASPSCSNDQGVILISPTGGNGPYNIVMENTTTGQPQYVQNGVSAAQFTGLSGGVYTITVTDANNCVETGGITLVRPDNFTPTISSTPLTCFNENTATVFTTVPSGRNVDATATYQYRLNIYDQAGANILVTSAPQSSVTFSGLGAGFYSITTSDGFGCEFTSGIEQILNPTEVVAQLIRTSPLTCATGVELELSATGGSGTYEYSVDDVNWITMTGSSAAIPNASITGPLGAGTYRYYVRDAINGCPSVQSNGISEDEIMPLAFTEVNATIIACVGDMATITADATGGLGDYMYELYTDVSLSVASRIAGPQSSGIFSNLTFGTYYVNVFSDDCTTPAEQVIIAEPIPLDYTEDVINALCFGDENGSITVTLSGGAGGYQYAISPNLNQFDTENTFDELAPGDYTVIAQDQNGCFIQLDYTITAPELLTATGVATPEVCAGDQDGTITLTIQGGTAPYSTRLSDEADFVQDRTDLTGLSADGYIIFVRDANGCMTDVGITIEPGVNLSATVEPVYECTGDTPDNYVNITLEDQTSVGDVLYALDSTDPADMQLNPDFRNTAPGSHYIAIAHANGCIQTIDFEIEDFEPLTLSLEQSGINTITATATGGLEEYTFYFDGVNNGQDNTYIIHRTDTFVVRVVDANGCEVIANIEMEFIDIEIPNFFTPDGDELNDIWIPLNQEGFPEILTIIFDRYGREVYRMTLNTPGWDGTYKLRELPTGDYWYVIKLRGPNDDREFVGHFTLYR